MPKTSNNKIGETFHRLTEDEAREWYERKYLNTTGYLLVIKQLFTKPDADFLIPDVLKFCREWGITKSSFYRAVNTLSADGKLCWEATQGIILKPKEKVVSIPRTGQCPVRGTVSHERDKSHERDESHERDKSHERDDDIYKERARDRSKTDLDLDLNQISPLAPLLKGGEEREVQIVDVEILDALSEPSPESMNLIQLLDETSASFGEDTNSGARCNNIEEQQSELGRKRYRRNEGRSTTNINGSDRLPWHTNKRNQYHPELEARIAKRLGRCDHYKGSLVGDLLTGVRRYIACGDFDLKRRRELEIEWEAIHSISTQEEIGLTVEQLQRKVSINQGMQAIAQKTPTHQPIQAPSTSAPDPSVQELKKELLQVESELKIAKRSLGKVLNAAFPGAYPPGTASELKAKVEVLERKALGIRTEIEQGF